MATLVSLQASESATHVRFHLSLNVDDLSRSIAFFRLLLGVDPAKRQSDYAKFEIDDPPLVLSLAPCPAPRGGKLNHLGFRLTSREALLAMQQRLEAHGLATNREEGVACCHARQTKFWLPDPDGNLWEIYVLEEDLDSAGGCAVPATPVVAAPSAAPAIWVHRLGEPFGTRLLIDSAGVDQVLLQGTFNARLDGTERQAMLGEVWRVLKPGGRVTLYQLSARSPLTTLSQPLPGPACAVESVPTAAELIDDLQAAGFVDLYFEKLAAAPCFVADGVDCRETQLVGSKPTANTSGRQFAVCYKGPWRQVEDDRGQMFRRGHWTTVDERSLGALRSSPFADQFVL